MITPEVRDRLIALAREAGDAILDVYGSDDLGVENKPDDSPLTKADRASHAVLSALDGYLALPLISEEGAVPPYSERKDWLAHWLIDPLDGTKEFIRRNDEFTVNVALIQDHRPTFGVVHVPVTGTTYVGGAGHGAVRMDRDGTVSIHVVEDHDGAMRVVASRSHRTAATDAYIDALGATEVVAAGSSLKFCRVAEGAADVYPRLGPTMEWDTAAAQAVVEGAGGRVLTGDAPLRYNREDMRNPHFLVAPTWFLERFTERVGAA